MMESVSAQSACAGDLGLRYYLIDALDRLVQREPISGHTPGHKNGVFLPTVLQARLGTAMARYDVTELEGLDNLHFSDGCLASSQQQTARICQAAAAYYLVNGTTAGLQAAIMATCQGQQVFVPRHAHRSIYHSLILAGAQPIYLSLTMDSVTGLPLGIGVETLRQAMVQHPQCRNLIMVHPTYQGLTWENGACIALAKAQGLTVIVDEAHGSHLQLHADLPPSALALGADLVVQSWHKTLPVLTQASVLLVGHSYQGPVLEHYLSLLQTTSPSYLLMASLEAASLYLAQEAPQQVVASLPVIAAFHQRINQALSTLQILWQPQWHQDPFKLYLLSSKLSGAALETRLREQYHIYAEMHDNNGCLLILPLATDEAWLAPIWDALSQIDQDSAQLPNQPATTSFYCQNLPQQRLSLTEAFRAPRQQLPWYQAIGRTAAQFILRYPPGIPLVVPGEEISTTIYHLWQQNGGDINELVWVLQEDW